MAICLGHRYPGSPSKWSRRADITSDTIEIGLLPRCGLLFRTPSKHKIGIRDGKGAEPTSAPAWMTNHDHDPSLGLGSSGIGVWALGRGACFLRSVNAVLVMARAASADLCCTSCASGTRAAEYLCFSFVNPRGIYRIHCLKGPAYVLSRLTVIKLELEPEQNARGRCRANPPRRMRRRSLSLTSAACWH